MPNSWQALIEVGEVNFIYKISSFHSKVSKSESFFGYFLVKFFSNCPVS